MRSPETQKYVEWAHREPGPVPIALTLALGACLFLAVLPYSIATAGGWLDHALGIPRFGSVAATVAGAWLMLLGAPLGVWAVVAEARIGRGTPVPMIPTQRLVVVPPFTYCRNPMILGTVTAYLGLGVLIGSVSAIVLVLLFAAVLLGYVKVLEERELEVRFGDEYVAYKQRTPFLLPRRPGRRRE